MEKDHGRGQDPHRVMEPVKKKKKKWALLCEVLSFLSSSQRYRVYILHGKQ
jgi:hypothetical protein